MENKIKIGSRYEDGFKAKAALEAVKEDKIIAEISEIYQAHQNLIGLRKKTLLEESRHLFSRKGTKDKEIEAKESRIEKLERQLGASNCGRDFLKKVQTNMRQRADLSTLK